MNRFSRIRPTAIVSPYLVRLLPAALMIGAVAVIAPRCRRPPPVRRPVPEASCIRSPQPNPVDVVTTASFKLFNPSAEPSPAAQPF